MTQRHPQSGDGKPRWMPLALSVFGVQLLLVWMVAERPGATGWTQARKPSVHLLQEQGRGLSTLNESLEADPALFALPDPRSFSGPAWLVPSPVQFEIPKARHEPRWLSPPVVWGADFAAFLRTNQTLAVTRLDSPNPPLFLLNLPPRQIDQRSSFRVSGPASARLQMPVPELPQLPLSSVLPELEVEVEVNADGNAVTARLLDEMVATTREQQADMILAGRESLSIARRLTFARSPERKAASHPFSHIETVRIVFEWAPMPSRQPPP